MPIESISGINDFFLPQAPHQKCEQSWIFKWISIFNSYINHQTILLQRLTFEYIKI